MPPAPETSRAARDDCRRGCAGLATDSSHPSEIARRLDVGFFVLRAWCPGAMHHFPGRHSSRNGIHVLVHAKREPPEPFAQLKGGGGCGHRRNRAPTGSTAARAKARAESLDQERAAEWPTSMERRARTFSMPPTASPRAATTSMAATGPTRFTDSAATTTCSATTAETNSSAATATTGSRAAGARTSSTAATTTTSCGARTATTSWTAAITTTTSTAASAPIRSMAATAEISPPTTARRRACTSRFNPSC